MKYYPEACGRDSTGLRLVCFANQVMIQRESSCHAFLFSGSCSSGLLLKKRGKGACATGACPQGGMGSHRTHTFVGLQKYEFTKSIVGFIFSRCWVVKSLRFRCFQAPYKEMPWLFSSVRTQNQSALLSVGSYFVHINGPI